MAVTEIKVASSRAENPWTYSVGADGTKTITERKCGTVEEMVNWAQAFVVGKVYSLTELGDCPFSGSWQACGARVDVLPGKFATAERTYSIPRGDTVGLENVMPEDLAREEELDLNPIEQPITGAKFWRDAFPETCEGNGGTGDGLEALKRVQLYIDAPSKDEADKIKATFTSKAEEKMAKFRMSGVEAYMIPAPVASVTVERLKAPDAFSDICKIVSKPEFEKLSAPSGFEWLCSGGRVTWSRGTGKFVVTRTWQAAEHWDRDLYTEAKKDGQ